MTEQNRPYEQGAGPAGPLPQSYPPSGVTEQADGGTQSAKDAAKDEAARVGREAVGRAQEVKDVATDQARDVTQTAKDQLKDTAAEARSQARSLYDQARHEVTDQAGTQQQRLAGGLRSFSSELSSMADGSEEQGLASSMTRQMADYLGRAGDWLGQREPGQVLDEVSRYARRHPGTFMVIAAGLGVLAGRVARGAKDANSDGASSPAGGRTARTSSAHDADAPTVIRTPVAARVDPAPSVGTAYPPPRPGGADPGYAAPAGSVDAPLSTPPGGRP